MSGIATQQDVEAIEARDAPHQVLGSFALPFTIAQGSA